MPAASAALEAPSPALSHWLTLLWGAAAVPPVQWVPADAGAPFIAGGRIHLAPAAHWHLQRAAAAHAAAHLVYSPGSGLAQAVEGLVPLARALVGVLEDARVEALAARELPGLARLWRAWHGATPELGDGSEALLQRLARALIDPGYEDPHAWVRKGRRLFFLDEPLGLPAVCTPADLRRVAMALGHDLGQARLPFNARGYRVSPAYRDDHRWLGAADRLDAVAPPPAPREAPTGPDVSEGPLAALPEPVSVRVSRHPEWDHRIRCLRPDWVTVHEALAPTEAGQHPRSGSSAASSEAALLAPWLLGLLRRQLRTHHALRRVHQDAGEGVDLDALTAWRVARRAGRPDEGRIFLSRVSAPTRAAVWLLIDQSASGADRVAPGGPRLLTVAVEAAEAMGQALQRSGCAWALSGFASEGRHAVHLRTLKGLREPLPAGVLSSRLQALTCAGSTRLGAVLRALTAQLRAWRAGPRWIVVLSDAQAHDIDVHDPRYLSADAREAVRGAARVGVRVRGLQVSTDAQRQPALRSARQLFGAGAVYRLPAVRQLPRILPGLLRG